MRRFLLGALFLILAGGVSHAALPTPRPFSGCGVLFLTQTGSWQPELLPLYREPGVQRVAELAPGMLPRLAGETGAPLVVVFERRRGWSRVALDDAGRRGWLKDERSWDYRDWREYLPGRRVRLLPGLKKEWYRLKSAPGGGNAAAELPRGREVRLVEVAGDWARVEAPGGWLRWRDGDGRLTVALVPAP